MSWDLRRDQLKPYMNIRVNECNIDNNFKTTEVISGFNLLGIGGNQVVATTAVLNDSEIMLSKRTLGANPGFLFITNINVGVSFTVQSSDVGDNDLFSWLLINH